MTLSDVLSKPFSILSGKRNQVGTRVLLYPSYTISSFITTCFPCPSPTLRWSSQRPTWTVTPWPPRLWRREARLWTVSHIAPSPYRQYRAYCHAQITHPRREALLRLPQRHLSILANSSVNPGESLNFVDYCIGENSLIAESILQHGIEIFPAVRSDNLAEKATQHDMEQAVSIIKQLYRDWSAEGLEERHASYDPFIQSLSSSFPVDPYQHYKIHVLVPGCGLGRLPYELCGHGFSVVGVEKSYHAAIASDYIINKCTQHQHVLYPWAYNFNNNVRRADQLAGVQIPDVEPQWAIGSEDPDVVPHQQRLAMHIGDFAVDFKALEHRGTFDAVVTCFFVRPSPRSDLKLPY